MYIIFARRIVTVLFELDAMSNRFTITRTASIWANLACRYTETVSFPLSDIQYFQIVPRVHTGRYASGLIYYEFEIKLRNFQAHHSGCPVAIEKLQQMGEYIAAYQMSTGNAAFRPVGAGMMWTDMPNPVVPAFPFPTVYGAAPPMLSAAPPPPLSGYAPGGYGPPGTTAPPPGYPPPSGGGYAYPPPAGYQPQQMYPPPPQPAAAPYPYTALEPPGATGYSGAGSGGGSGGSSSGGYTAPPVSPTGTGAGGDYGYGYSQPYASYGQTPPSPTRSLLGNAHDPAGAPLPVSPKTKTDHGNAVPKTKANGKASADSSTVYPHSTTASSSAASLPPVSVDDLPVPR